jgi:uncharacterized membrane protein YfcA
MALWEIAAYLATGVASGLLAGLFGVGGGVVVVPALLFVFPRAGLGPEWIPHLAVGTSLAAIVATGATSAYAHHRRGAVRWDLVTRLAPGIAIGAWSGAAVAGILPDTWLKRIFACFLLYVGAHMLVRRGDSAHHPMPGTSGMLAVGAGIGALSALVGIGGGTMTAPFLSRVGIDMRRAVATSAACGVPIAVAGALGFVAVGWGRQGLPAASTGFVYWPAVAAILAASVPAAPLGAHLAHRLPVDLLKRVFAVLLLAMGAKLLLA